MISSEIIHCLNILGIVKIEHLILFSGTVIVSMSYLMQHSKPKMTYFGLLPGRK